MRRRLAPDEKPLFWIGLSKRDLLAMLDSATKVDLIVRKNSAYRHAVIERRKAVEFAGISTWITSREDLILSAFSVSSTRDLLHSSLRFRH